MDVAGVHHRRGISGASNDDTLGKNFTVFTCGSLAVLGLLPPFLRCEWDVLIRPSLLALGHPAGGSVLSVADCFGFDIVEAVHIRQQCDPAEDAEHDGSDDNQSCNA